MDTMSVQDAAGYLGVTQKTIYRYLDAHKLSSEKIGLVHFIPRSEVEAMRLSRHVPMDEKTHQEQRIDTLYELFAAHDFRLAHLEEQLRHVQERPQRQETPSLISPSSQPPQRHKAPEPRQTHAPVQPEGTITLAELSARVGRNEKTILGHLLKWDRAPEKYPQFEHIKIPVASRPGTYSRYFSTSQAEEIASWIQQHARHV